MEDMIIISRSGGEAGRGGPPRSRKENWAKNWPNCLRRGGIDYVNAKRLMLITSRTPDPVMVKA